MCEAGEDGSAPSILPLGWVTAQQPIVPSTRPTAWSSTPMARPRPAAPDYIKPLGMAALEGTDLEC